MICVALGLSVLLVAPACQAPVPDRVDATPTLPPTGTHVLVPTPSPLRVSPTIPDEPTQTNPVVATVTPSPVEDLSPIVVDNRDAGFATAGDWYPAMTGQRYGEDCLWAHRGIQNNAYFRPDLPLAGVYDVSAWWCGDPNHDQTPQLHLEIHATSGRVAPNVVVVNLQENGGSWQSLGHYRLGPGAQVVVAGSLHGSVIADAVQFRYLGPDAPEMTPSPTPTPFPWTNHPPSPVEQLTAGDLTARLGIVQPRFSYAHTPIAAITEQSFDDCVVFAREGCGGLRAGWQVTVTYKDLAVDYRVAQDYRHVSLAPNADLTAGQMLYLYGADASRYVRVETFAERPGVWHLSVAAYADVPAMHRELDAATAALVFELAQRYGPVSLQAEDGLTLVLYGLGPLVELAADDAARLADLGAALIAELPSP